MKKHTLINNLKYFNRMIMEQDPSIFLLILVYTIFAGIGPIIMMYFPKLLISEITGLQRILYIIAIIFGCIITHLICNIISQKVQHSFFPKILRFRFFCMRMIGKRAMEMDYQELEEVATQENISKASEATGNFNIGIEGTYRKIFKTPSLLFTTIFTFFISSQVSIVLVIILCSFVFINFFLGLLSNKMFKKIMK